MIATNASHCVFLKYQSRFYYYLHNDADIWHPCARLAGRQLVTNVKGVGPASLLDTAEQDLSPVWSFHYYLSLYHWDLRTDHYLSLSSAQTTWLKLSVSVKLHPLGCGIHFYNYPSLLFFSLLSPSSPLLSLLVSAPLGPSLLSFPVAGNSHNCRPKFPSLCRRQPGLAWPSLNAQLQWEFVSS